MVNLLEYFKQYLADEMDILLATIMSMEDEPDVKAEKAIAESFEDVMLGGDCSCEYIPSGNSYLEKSITKMIESFYSFTRGMDRVDEVEIMNQFLMFHECVVELKLRLKAKESPYDPDIGAEAS